ncbi:MAG: SpoIVB peptidase S55 domain-containing protein [bacterium]
MTIKKMCRLFISACFFLVLFLFLAVYQSDGPVAAEETAIMPLEEVEPGMTGYGLSVWQGTEVERFRVEVVDVVPNFANDKPVILMTCKGRGLEKTRIIAGMSGSPIFIEGKLVGALAYSWAFAREPIAGITPIEYMLKVKDRGKPAVPAEAAGLASLQSGTPEKSSRRGRVVPIATPLITSGFSRRAIRELEEELEPFNMVPVAGGGLGTAELDPEAARKLEPGSALGAALMLGDLSMVGTGTLSYRQGDRVLGFGHAFMQGGAVSVPLVASKIHTVINSQEISFKLSSPTAVVGEMTYDHQAAISGELGKEPSMTPFDINIENPETGFKKSYNIKMAKVPALLPTLVKIGLRDIIRSAVPSLDPTTVRVRSRIRLKDYGEAEFENLYAIRQRNFTMGYLEPVLFLARNPFARVEMEKVQMDLTVDNDLGIAAIESVRTSTDEVKPGSTVEVTVTVKPYDSPSRDFRFQVYVPDHRRLKEMNLIVAGGSRAPPDAAHPRSVPDMIRFMKKVYPADRLVVFYKVPGAGLDVQGRRLDNLPPSAVSMLQPPNAKAVAMSGEKMYYSQKVPYVVMGSQRIKLKVAREDEKKR